MMSPPQRTTTLFGLVILFFSWFNISSCLAPPRTQSTANTLDFSEYTPSDSQELSKRADPNLAGYLGVFFLGADPYVYFYLSNGNDPLSFKALNRGSPIARPTKGTGGVRDPTIIPGGGAEAGKKWYIIGTDLHIGKVSSSCPKTTPC